jgi:hypothetical protein
MLGLRRRRGVAATWTDVVQLAGYLLSIVGVGIAGEAIWNLLGSSTLAWTTACVLAVGPIIWAGVTLNGLYLLVFGIFTDANERVRLAAFLRWRFSWPVRCMP